MVPPVAQERAASPAADRESAVDRESPVDRVVAVDRAVAKSGSGEIGGGADGGGGAVGGTPPHGDFLDAIDDRIEVPSLAAGTTHTFSFRDDLLPNDWIPSHPLAGFRRETVMAQSPGKVGARSH